jgi:hypothetical protein
MRSWVEVTRSIPGVATTESFEHFHRAVTQAFRAQDDTDCQCITIHTVYPDDKYVAFAFAVKTPSFVEARQIAEESVDAALGSVFVLGT